MRTTRSLDAVMKLTQGSCLCRLSSAAYMPKNITFSNQFCLADIAIFVIAEVRQGHVAPGKEPRTAQVRCVAIRVCVDVHACRLAQRAT